MTYIWVFLAFLSAFSLATSDALVKRSLESGNEYLVAWLRLVFTLPLLLAIAVFIPIPNLDGKFCTAFLIALPVEILALVLYIKALKYSALSLTLPFLSITPIILIVVSFLMLGEKVTLKGGAGIFLIAMGSYTLNLKERSKGLFGPFRAITREKGSVLMIVVAVLYSLTSSLGKMAITHSSPLFFGVTYFTAVTVLYTPVALFMGRGEIRQVVSDSRMRKTLITAGLFNSVMVMTHMTAMSLTKVAYMISVKRISLLIGVGYGYLLFREDIRTRLPGALLMFAGFVLVVTAK